jgi:hypothetical protein
VVEAVVADASTRGGRGERMSWLNDTWRRCKSYYAMKGRNSREKVALYDDVELS